MSDDFGGVAHCVQLADLGGGGEGDGVVGIVGGAGDVVSGGVGDCGIDGGDWIGPGDYVRHTSLLEVRVFLSARFLG